MPTRTREHHPQSPSCHALNTMRRTAAVALFAVSASLPSRCTVVAAFATIAEPLCRHHASKLASACKQRRICLANFIVKRSFGSLQQEMILTLHANLKEDSCSGDISADPSIEEDRMDPSFDANRSKIPTEMTNRTIPSYTSPSFALWGVPLQSIILLNIAALIWGTQHAVIKSVVDDISLGPDVWFREWLQGVWGTYRQESTSGKAIIRDGDAAAYFTLARFGLAALLASPYTPGLDAYLNQGRGRDSDEDGVKVVPCDSDNDRKNFDSTEDTDVQTQQSKQAIHRNPSTAISHETDIAEGNETSLSWRYGLELGIYMFLGYAFQAIGLESTTASRSGFLLYLNVKLVPFFSFLIFGKRIRTTTWISALVAFLGTALLSLDNANGGSSHGSGVGLDFALNAGDLWSIAAAAASAMFILRMEEASKAVPKSSELNAASLWTVFVISFFWTAVVTWKNNASHIKFGDMFNNNAQVIATTIQSTVAVTVSTIIDHPLQLIYLSAVTTTLANYIQSKGQKDVSAERASIIYAMDPVYGAFFANLLLGEQLGAIGWVGSALIVAAAVTNAVWDFGRADDDG